ncbi:MAG: M14 family zinc carboxypeptidase [Aeoliella sp.]
MMRTYPFDELRPTDKLLRALHQQYRVSPSDTSTLRHADVARTLAGLETQSKAVDEGNRLKLRSVGESFEGRTLQLASIGRGPIEVLMWTQMHGDEATHTAVVLDLLSALVASPNAELAGCKLLDKSTLHILPMLNPDGAERQTRRSAEEIDINRDAVDLATPEARVLHQVVRDVRPAFAFNLHNQRATTPVADTGRVATVSVMAPPIDSDGTTPPSVVRAKQLALEMFATAERLLPGHATKYNADYMPTAFGEWVQTRGVTTVLLEAGGWPDETAETMVELHFVVLASALRAIADDLVEQIDASRYEQLPLNGKKNREKR